MSAGIEVGSSSSENNTTCYLEKTDYGEIKISPIDIALLNICTNQVAGHGTRKKSKELSLLVRDGKIFKAIQPGKKRSWSEVQFYENQIKHAPFLLPFIPTYYGVQRAFVEDDDNVEQQKEDLSKTGASSSMMDSLYLHQAGNSSNVIVPESTSSEKHRKVKHIDFLVLEDITTGMEHPNVMDIKMGQRTYGEDASPEKILEEESKYAYQHTLGMRISGAKIYDYSKKEYQYFDRQWGRKVIPETLVDAMDTFFFSKGFDDETRVNIGIHSTSQTLKELKKIYHVFTEKNDKFRMYASSILVVYDKNKNFSLKVIDFSHVHENDLDQPVYDTSFIHGVATIISVLEQLIGRYSSTITNQLR